MTCDGPLIGELVFPTQKDKHASEWFVCWECEIAQPTTAVWVSIKAKAVKKAKRGKLINWMKHTNVHWQAYIGGDRLDYWPTKRKWRFRGETRTGDVEKFIKGLEP